MKNHSALCFELLCVFQQFLMHLVMGENIIRHGGEWGAWSAKGVDWIVGRQSWQGFISNGTLGTIGPYYVCLWGVFGGEGGGVWLCWDEGWWVVSSWDHHDVWHHIWAWISGHAWARVLGGLGVAGIVGAGLLWQPQCWVSTVEDQVKSIILSTRTEESKGWTISQELVIQMALTRVLQISEGECSRRNQELKRCKEGWSRSMGGKVYLPKMLWCNKTWLYIDK